jgi:hypothetical protein
MCQKTPISLDLCVQSCEPLWHNCFKFTMRDRPWYLTNLSRSSSSSLNSLFISIVLILPNRWKSEVIRPRENRGSGPWATRMKVRSSVVAWIVWGIAFSIQCKLQLCLLTDSRRPHRRSWSTGNKFNMITLQRAIITQLSDHQDRPAYVVDSSSIKKYH